MRVLLFGANGLVGRHLRVALADHEVVATSRTGNEGTRVVDLRDGVALAALVSELRPEVILNAAAEAYVEPCEREPIATRAVNVEPVRGLADLARETDSLLVVFSSEYVFDGTRGQYTEDDEVSPINEYGRQKVDLERIAATAPRHLSCRTSGVFGEDPQRKNFVFQLVDRLRAGQNFAVPSDQLITPSHAPALARAVVELVEAGAVGIHHCAGPRIMGRMEFATAVTAAFGLDQALLRPRPTAELKLTAPRPQRAGLSDAKLRRVIGHSLTQPDAALREMAATKA